MRFKHLFVLGMFVLGLAITANSSEQLPESDWLGENIENEFQTNLEQSHALATLASGAECPVGSGAYCDDKTPVCCLVSGKYGCYKKLSDCVEK